MEQIALGTTGRHTTRLGFGCANLMGATGRRDSLKLLEAAYDAGIRHFDVAARYGYGAAESCLGEFLQRHRGQVTVTTKYGTLPVKRTALISLGRRIVGPVVKKLPGLKQRLAPAANKATRNPERPSYTAAQAKTFLDRSLAALRTDHIDLWLLHEASASDLQDDALLRLLEDLVQQGIIGSFGVGSSADKVPALLAERPAYCRSLQYEWSVLDAPIQTTELFRIHHRALTSNFLSIHTALINNKSLCKRWSASTNSDLSNPEALAALMLKASLVMNPGSVILFSSKNPQHIQANVRTAADPALELPARQLHHLVQSESDQLPIPLHPPQQ
ncbi:MAG TPA: aldo/keto reductase [Edaphobacter sp.]|nr:aldo/keto reductase [Edaphobacter sp.]